MCHRQIEGSFGGKGVCATAKDILHKSFAPVARMDTLRMIVALAAQRRWTLYQLDVKSAFLQGELNEEVYVEQPKGYELKNSPHKVYRLKKAL